MIKCSDAVACEGYQLDCAGSDAVLGRALTRFIRPAKGCCGLGPFLSKDFLSKIAVFLLAQFSCISIFPKKKNPHTGIRSLAKYFALW